MIQVILVIVMLHSGVTLERATKQYFGMTGDCMDFINATVDGAQRLANKTFKEKTEVTLKCRARHSRDA